MFAKLSIRALILTLGAFFCLQGAVLAQSSTSNGGADLGANYGDKDTILSSIKAPPKVTTAFKISTESINNKSGTNGVAANTVTDAIMPYFIQLFAFFRFICLAWLLILTVVIGMGFALQQSKLEDLVMGVMGGAIVLGAQVFAGLFVFTTTSS